MDPFIQMSAFISKKAAVCSDEPIATKVGLDILKMGGNAADAAIATFAVVSMIQPYMSGIGGDIQCLFYNKSDKTVLQLNGSGRTGKNTLLEKVKESGIKVYQDTKYNQQGLWVSIPGAVAGIFHLLRNFGSGKLSMADLLQPAIELAEEGVIIPSKTASFWQEYSQVFRSSRNSRTILIDNRPPKAGEILTFPELAKCYKEIASTGTKGFYNGQIAQKIVDETTNACGSLTLEDFEEFERNPPSSTTSKAISIDFYKFRIWEMRPNTIGIVALVMFKVLEKFELKGMKHNSADYIHILSEVTKLSYLECWDYLCDPDYCSENIDNLLSDRTANKLKDQLDLNRASKSTKLVEGGSTSYLAVVDNEGNGCSFIASVSSAFGSGLIPDDCGFVLNVNTLFTHISIEGDIQ